MIKSPKKGSATKAITRYTLLFTVLIFIWNIFSDRLTPSTDQARVKGLILPMAPMVSGYVTQVNVGLHSEVKQGDTLFLIDKEPFEIALRIAESNLENATQSVDAGTSAIKSAVARLNRAKVNLDRASKNWERTQRVITKHVGALSEADKDRSEASYLNAVEQVVSAQAALDQQRAALGPTDENNPNIKAVLNQIEKAQWDLSNTAIVAPSEGIIESFNIEKGYFARAGNSLVTLVSNQDIWIQANLKENNLGNIEIGDEVSIVFDIRPGKVYKGAVSSVAYGVSTDRTNSGDLPTVNSSQGWLRDPQRFPVIIQIDNSEIIKELRQGSQAEVVVYTGNNFVLNGLAAFRIWLLSKLSYVR
ncbi:HlyD family secretion protein [Mangrovimonas futianensis]|uniref:HlyD family secretion protein n=1 Tax=Mangrovimonas futianensis TaxID=2895523 RepID=UPI001E48BFC2|nr:HlyD family secretion protein [Mangrovimonas futianensis]MCF1421189.1 HlyD family secretion protein [Mangrovimonas futianensis]